MVRSLTLRSVQSSRNGFTVCEDFSTFHLFGSDTHYSVAQGHFHLCGAAIISSTYIVTCAHCVRKHNNVVGGLGFLSLVLGMYKMSEVNSEQRYCVDKIMIHDKYSVGNLYDIALLQLTRSIDVEKVRPIPFSKTFIGLGEFICCWSFICCWVGFNEPASTNIY